VSQETTTDFQLCRDGRGGVKKCFLSIRQTAPINAAGCWEIMGKTPVSINAAEIASKEQTASLLEIFLVWSKYTVAE
jgi:hypothetical protein